MLMILSKTIPMYPSIVNYQIIDYVLFLLGHTESIIEIITMETKG